MLVYQSQWVVAFLQRKCRYLFSVVSIIPSTPIPHRLPMSPTHPHRPAAPAPALPHPSRLCQYMISVDVILHPMLLVVKNMFDIILVGIFDILISIG